MAGSWLHADQLSADQRRNVATIIAVGKRLGASQRDITIALMAAAQESEFKNINYGDRAGPDSRGLFQQRAPWGTLADRMNPAKAAAMFFTGGHGGQRGLFDFKNRDRMAPTLAAQAVQVSAYPTAYAKHEGLARALLGSTPALEDHSPTVTPAKATTVAPTPTTTAGQVAPTPGTVTVNPTVDKTVTQTPITVVSQNPVPPSADPLAPIAPGAGAATAPGAEAADAPGAQAVTTPGLPASPTTGVGDPPADPLPRPQTSSPGSYTTFPTLGRQEFHDLFPDAAASKLFTGASRPSTATGAPSGRRADVVSAAMSYVGTPYVWGGNSRSGVDCSGLVQQVYKSFGVNVPRLSADQARSGKRVAVADLQPGDLVAMDNSSRNNGADHIAIYAGNGYIIEAPRPGLRVRKRKIAASEKGWFGVHFSQF